jgi:mannitol-specific phosphotransferase system IIBC component
MSSSQFDEFTKTLTTATSRRQALKALAATGIAALVAFNRSSSASAWGQKECEEECKQQFKECKQQEKNHEEKNHEEKNHQCEEEFKQCRQECKQN